MKSLSRVEILSIGLMMFSIFFGAGNLIFPPALGQAAGTNLLPAITGFLVTGVGLPLLGVVAIAMKGGEYTAFIERHVSPRFALVLLGILYITIGPLFAIPRTGAVSFEIGIRPFLGWDDVVPGQVMYTAVFFLLTYYLALNPGKIVDRVGKMLTPILLLFLAVLFIRSFTAPLGSILEPQGIYRTLPFVQGFKDGYLTMDLLASIAVGAIVVNAIRMSGIEDSRVIGRVCLIGGLIAVALMSIVYLSLGYLGATSAQALGLSANGGVILSAAAGLFFCPMGQVLLAVIIAFACLTTSCGMASAFASYFYEASHHQIAYQRLLLAGTLFSFAASNIGLTGLIRISVPFLVTIYPVVIVLVLLSLADRFFGGRRAVYRCSLAFTLAFSVFGGLSAAGIQLDTVDALFSRYIPLYEANLGWMVPALLGAAVGGAISVIFSHGDHTHAVEKA